MKVMWRFLRNLIVLVLVAVAFWAWGYSKGWGNAGGESGLAWVPSIMQEAQQAGQKVGIDLPGPSTLSVDELIDTLGDKAQDAQNSEQVQGLLDELGNSLDSLQDGSKDKPSAKPNKPKNQN